MALIVLYVAFCICHQKGSQFIQKKTFFMWLKMNLLLIKAFIQIINL